MKMLSNVPIKKDTKLLLQIIDGRNGCKSPPEIVTPRVFAESLDRIDNTMLGPDGDIEDEEEIARFEVLKDNLPNSYVDVLVDIDQVLQLSEEERKGLTFVEMIRSFPLLSVAQFRDFCNGLKETSDEENQSESK